MAYQPIVRVSEKKLVAYECLLRSEESTLANPALFIETAEQLGRLHELGREIRRQIAATISESDPTIQFFVNLHLRDLLDEELFSPSSPLTRHAKQIVLEVTERASLDSIPDTRARILRLRELGFRIAIDDLGAGYAGLSCFALLSPEVVKLDMFLVRNIDADPTKQRLVRSMAELCRDLGMQVICEGVETPAERDALAALGCYDLQGYLFARPARRFPRFNGKFATRPLASAQDGVEWLEKTDPSAVPTMARSNRRITFMPSSRHWSAPMSRAWPSAPFPKKRSRSSPKICRVPMPRSCSSRCARCCARWLVKTTPKRCLRGCREIFR